MLICTVATHSTFNSALMMAMSVRNRVQASKLVLCLIEEDSNETANHSGAFDEIVLAKNLPIPDFKCFMFRHTEKEAHAAVKGALFHYVLHAYPGESIFVYLDPNMLVEGPLKELEQVLSKHPLVLLPHSYTPESNDSIVKHTELLYMKYGSFQPGMIGINRSKLAEEFVKWYCKRLFESCYDSLPHGLYLDQKWLNLAYLFFSPALLKHPGYGVAEWNIGSRQLTEQYGEYTVDHEPLQLVNFSTLPYEHNGDEYTAADSPFQQMAQNYRNHIENVGFAVSPTWSYDRYYSGESIAIDARIEVRNQVKRYEGTDPFTLSNDTIRQGG